ncbi:MAG: hypothetical protein SYC29_06720 [Planctomycetota bacterium]|nr:hypothetical protein [Planctomycetota bacterium]
MKRSTLFLFAGAVACAMSTVTLAGDWFDDFEAYDCDADICAADGVGGWVFWDGSDSSPTAKVSCATDGYPVFEGQKSLRGLGGANADDIVHTYSFINTGYWAYTAWQYIPSTVVDGQAHYFILLNQWEPNGGGATNWSTQLECNPTRGVIESEFEDVTLPLVTDQWVEVKVLINLFESGLGSDMQSIFYNGSLLSRKSWTEGVSGGGTLSIQAVDLWFNDVTLDFVYYDDMSLVQLPETGACCFDDGTCDDDQLADDCATAGGRFQGIGSICSGIDCPVYGDCGWELTGPTTFFWTTVGQGDTCDFVGNSEDEQFTVEIPFTGEWSFSLCGGADWDTVLAFDPDECCGFAEFDDNGCPSGFQSLLNFPELAAGTYYLNLEDVSGQGGGDYTLTVDTPCILECPDGGVAEQEACGDDTNGGCNMDTPAFEDIFLDTPICGKAYYDGPGGTRDTDWYEYQAGGAEDLVFSGTAEFLCVIGLIQYNEGFEGSGDCADISGYISPFTQTPECQEGQVEVSLPVAGTYWFFVAPDFGNDVIQCGDEDALENDYVVMLSAAGDDCPWDFDGNDVVNTADLLFLLGAWGTPDGDVNDDGTTNTADLLDLLGNWGNCP